MANEPERPIEKLLRSCAEKRRQEAGAPLDLHPANRQMLQAEVNRVFTKPRSGQRRFGFLPAKWWAGMAWGGAGLAVMVVVSAFFWPAPTRRGQIRDLAKNENARVATPRSLEQLSSPTAAAPGILIAGQSKPEGSANLELAAREAEAPRALTYRRDSAVPASAKDARPASAQPAPPNFAPGAPPALNQQTLFVTQNIGAQGAAQQQGARGMTKLSAGRLADNVRAAAAQSAVPVLASFRVEQTGQQIRIIDQDGSVYSGSLGPAIELPGLNANRLLQSNAPVSVREEARSQLSKGSAAAPAIARNYSFLVSGTNLSVNQQVVFRGELMPMTNRTGLGVAGGTAGARGGSSTAPAGLETLSLPDCSILGRAIIGGSEVPIEAEPAR